MIDDELKNLMLKGGVKERSRKRIPVIGKKFRRLKMPEIGRFDFLLMMNERRKYGSIFNVRWEPDMKKISMHLIGGQ